MKWTELDSNGRHHYFKAERLERLATCHKVLIEGRERDMADLIMKHSNRAEDGLSAQDAALQAIQQGHGRMEDAASAAAYRAREELHVMGASSRARANGLFLADYMRTFDDQGPSCRHTYMLAFVEPQRVRGRADRLALTCALDAGLVGPATHCQHSHDCCGHWYSSRAQVRWIAPNLFIVYQDSHQNV